MTYLAVFIFENCVTAVHVFGIIFPSAYIDMDVVLYFVILKEEQLTFKSPQAVRPLLGTLCLVGPFRNP
jgi:hypothetical protein